MLEVLRKTQSRIREVKNAGTSGGYIGASHRLNGLRPLETQTSYFPEPEDEIYLQAQLIDACKSHVSVL